jgi:hypothetical protein
MVKLINSQIIAWVVTQGLDVLKTCSSRKPFASVKAVEELIRITKNMDTFPDKVTAQIADLDAAMNPSDATNFFGVEMLQAIDNVAADKFGGCLNQIGIPESRYLGNLKLYVREVISFIRQYGSPAEHSELVVARFIWAMHRRVGKITPMPLMTQKVIEATVISAAAVELGTSEVRISILVELERSTGVTPNNGWYSFSTPKGDRPFAVPVPR